MSQIEGRWIADHQINNSKIDNSAVYNVGGIISEGDLTVNSDTSIGGTLDVGANRINMTLSTFGVDDVVNRGYVDQIIGVDLDWKDGVNSAAERDTTYGYGWPAVPGLQGEPQNGWTAYVKDEHRYYTFVDQKGWVDYYFGNINAPSVDAVAESTRKAIPSGFLPAADSAVGYVKELSDFTSNFKVYTGGNADALPRTSSYGALYTSSLTDASTGDANNMYLAGDPMKVNVNGFEIIMEGRDGSFANQVISLPEAPSDQTRTDMVIMEVWKEEVEPGSMSDVLFPYGNINYMKTGIYDNCTLLNADSSAADAPAYLDSSSVHGYYVKSNDPYVKEFISNPKNNVGVGQDNKFFQIRWRLASLSNVSVEDLGTGSLDKNVTDAIGNWYAPQGMKASRPPATPSQTQVGGIFVPQVDITIPESTVTDSGLWLGGEWTGNTVKMGAISGLSLDGFVYAIPVALVNRRNQTAWSLPNMNGAGALGASSGRPDGKFFDHIHKDDILDLRHRVSASGHDVKAVQEESMQQILKSDLTTKFESYKTDYAGTGSYADSKIYGTKLLRAEGVNASAFPSSNQVSRIAECSSGKSADPDGMRNYYSDVEGEQVIQGRIPNENNNDILGGAVFSYSASTHEIESYLPGALASNDGAGGARTIHSYRQMDLYWSGPEHTTAGARPGEPVMVSSLGTMINDRNTVTIRDHTYTHISFLSVSTHPSNGSVYRAPNFVDVTINGKSSAVDYRYSGYYNGGTPPSTGTWAKQSGTGDSSLTCQQLENGRRYLGYSPAMSHTVYVGEGYDLHDGESIFINNYVKFSVGSGLLTRVPYDNGDKFDGRSSIKASHFNVSGVQSLPNDGVDFIPFNQRVSQYWANNTGFVSPDTHTKSMGLAGFFKKTPVIRRGTEGTYDGHSLSQPKVIKDGSTYKMWYKGTQTTTIRNSILYAESTDGVTWTNNQVCYKVGPSNPGLLGAQGTYDLAEINIGSVILDGSTYRMWYTGWGDGTWGSTRVIYCDSNDGITWDNFTVVISPGSAPNNWDNAGLNACSVIKEGGTYRMLYEGFGGAEINLVYTESTDGISWTNKTPSIRYNTGVNSDLGGQYMSISSLIKDGPVYKAFISFSPGGYQSMCAVSTDCKVWGRPFNVAESGDRNIDSPSIGYYPTVIKDGKLYKFWTSGKAYSELSNEIMHGVYTCTDSANTGSSTTGVYSTEGTLNHAVAAGDSAIVFYEARAHQQDVSRFGGNLSTSTGTLEHILRYLPSKMILTSCGTGGIPVSTAYFKAYRDFIATIFAKSGVQYGFGLPFSTIVQDQIMRGIADQRWLCFNDNVSYALTNERNNASTPIKPTPGDFVSKVDMRYIWSAADIEGTAIMGSLSTANNGQLFADICCGFSETFLGTNTFPFLGGVGEKNKELFMPALIQDVYGPARSEGRLTIATLFNLVGRPLVK